MTQIILSVLLFAVIAAGISSPVAAGGIMDIGRETPVSSMLHDVYTTIGIGAGSMSEKLAFLAAVSVTEFSPASHQGFSFSRTYLPCRF